MKQKNARPGGAMNRTLLVLILTLFGSGSALAFSGGDGSPENPYQVATAEHLDAVRNHMTAHFVQVADIDLGVAPWNEGAGWEPIGNSTNYFRGHYDGQSHTIDGLYINRSADNVGLFGRTQGSTILNLGLTNVNIRGVNYVGGLVGRNHGVIANTYVSGTVNGYDFVGGLAGEIIRISGSSINQSHSTASVSGTNRVGGLIGYSDRGGSISQCFSSGAVSGDDHIGGLVGYCIGTTVTQSFATSAVNGSNNVGGLLGYYVATGPYVTHCYARGPVLGDNRVGGLVGSYSLDSSREKLPYIGYSYAAGEVSGTGDFVGGLVGYAEGGRVVERSFWDVEVTGQATSGGGKGVETALMQTVSTFGNLGWGGNDWVMEEGDYPRLSWEAEGLQPLPDPGPVALQGSGTEADPYLVTNAAEFASLSWHVGLLDKHIKLDANIDLSGMVIHPIGCSDTFPYSGSFSGVFDGAGHEIMNVTIHQPVASYVGVFASTTGSAKITNLTIRNAEIQGNHYVGGLVGSGGGSLIGCRVIGAVRGSSYVGGLAGNHHTREITDCHVEVQVIATGVRVGGLLGRTDQGLSYCSASGIVSGGNEVGGLVGGQVGLGTISHSHADCQVNGNDLVGGLAGRSADVQNSQAFGDVVATGNRVGGLAGKGGSVMNCFAAGNVSGVNEVGGLVGEGTIVRRNYATGDVNGVERVGGLAGTILRIIASCYATGAVHGVEAVGGLVGIARVGSGTTDELSQIYSTGLVTGKNYVGGLIGEMDLSWRLTTSRVTQGFWDTTTSAQPGSAGGQGLPTTKMQTVSVFQNAGWGGEDWVMVEGEYPRLAWEETGFAPVPAPGPVPLVGSGGIDDPFLIRNTEEFVSLGWHVGILDKHIQLDADIDLTGQAMHPIGLLGDFTGVFNGAGHSITNLVLNRPKAPVVGLFSEVGKNGNIRGIALENVDVVGHQKVGGLVGFNRGTVQDSYVTGQISGVEHVGGLVGENHGSLSRTFATASVSGETVVGGLVGQLGMMYDYDSRLGWLEASYSSGDVQATGDYVGGLVGRAFLSTIRSCFASGSVSGARNVGGLVGICESSTVIHSYATGFVTGTVNYNLRGLIGSTPSGIGTFTANYWDIETTGKDRSHVGGVGLSTEDMTYPYAMEAYEGWDFAEVWAEDTDGTINGGYPYLAYTLQYEAGPGGALEGAPVQRVPLGELSEMIAVLPDAGAEFVGWSDGTMDNPRMDGRLSGNLSVTAHFRSTGGVDIDWYGSHGIMPAAGQTWADVDGIDWQGKGMTLQEEFLAGTDPTDPQSRFAATPPAAGGTGFEIHFQPSLPERRYTLFRTTDLTETDWLVVPGMQNVPGGNGPMVDTEPPEGSAFYRIEVSLP